MAIHAIRAWRCFVPKYSTRANPADRTARAGTAVSAPPSVYLIGELGVFVEFHPRNRGRISRLIVDDKGITMVSRFRHRANNFERSQRMA